jgi:6-phosphogluconolactonase
VNVEVLPDATALALRAANLFAAAAQVAAAARGRCAVALSGGETPRGLYTMLARQQFSQKVPWRRVRLYWGDERCVPPDDPASNYGMAREVLIRHVPIPVANVRALHGEDEPSAAALAYENDLRALAALERPRSDVPVFDLSCSARRRRVTRLRLPAQPGPRAGIASASRRRTLAAQLGSPSHTR